MDKRELWKHRSLHEKVEARAKAMEQIEEELRADGALPVAVISKRLGLNQSTAQKYLIEMWRDQRKVRRTSERDKYNRVLWEAGEDPALPSPDDFLEQQFAPKQKVGAAHQIGMKRDPLVAALFGPAPASV